MDRQGQVRDHVVAGLWGFAEATAFFIVPDVWTSRVALRHPRRALATTASAVVGAMVGGAVVHRWASRTPASGSARAMARVPGITPAMVERVDVEVARDGMRALLIGPTKGVPYKLYARSLALAGVPVERLAVWTVPARAGRFLLVTGATGGLETLARRLGVHRPRLATLIHGVGWATFYAWYFSVIGRADVTASAPPRTGRSTPRPTR